MFKSMNKTAKELTLKQLVYVLLLSAVIFNFLLSLSSNGVSISILPTNNMAFSLVLFFSVLAVFTVYIVICGAVAKRNYPPVYASIIMFPITVLLHANSQNGFLLPVASVAVTSLMFYLILFRRELFKISEGQCKKVLALIAIAYFIFISFLILQNYFNDTLFNMKDFRIYEETFRNTIHGRFFQNSVYGSNFACHNTWFFLLIIPFYYIIPHPMTPMVIKTLLISFSVIPFYLIAKLHVKVNAIIPLVLCFLFYPYIISQNFLPQHEICYLPFFLLFTIYFFKVNKFKSFIIFLILILSIKEHLALIAIMFGIRAFFQKKTMRWVAVPILFGILWAIFSFLILSHFREVYSSLPVGTWLIDDFKTRFLYSGDTIISSLKNGLLTSNLANSFTMGSVAFKLLLPIGIIIPLLGPITYLCLPELGLNLLSNRSALLSPTWHYNVVVACCLLIGMIEGLSVISKSRFIKRLMIDEETMVLLTSFFMLASTVMYFYLWFSFI